MKRIKMFLGASLLVAGLVAEVAMAGDCLRVSGSSDRIKVICAYVKSQGLKCLAGSVKNVPDGSVLVEQCEDSNTSRFVPISWAVVNGTKEICNPQAADIMAVANSSVPSTASSKSSVVQQAKAVTSTVRPTGDCGPEYPRSPEGRYEEMPKLSEKLGALVKWQIFDNVNQADTNRVSVKLQRDGNGTVAKQIVFRNLTVADPGALMILAPTLRKLIEDHLRFIEGKTISEDSGCQKTWKINLDGTVREIPQV